jgi:hypothetical protein
MIRLFQKVVAKLMLGSFDFLVGKFTANKSILHPADIPFYHQLMNQHKIILNDYLKLVNDKN